MKDFGTYTKDIIKKLPYWFYMRKQNTNSIGASFLDCFGLELDDIRYILDYCFEQVYINTVDVKQKDIIYRIELEDEFNINTINEVRTDVNTLIKSNILNDFLALTPNYLKGNTPYDIRKYFIDEVRKIIYLNINSDIYINDVKYIPVPHHVWNVLDEFGMLVCCPRLFGEKNKDYKDRILDVFINKANSSCEGLLNGLSRELGLRKKVIWKDCGKNLVLNDTMILLNTIKVNNHGFNLNDIYIDYNYNVILKGSSINSNKQAEVTYVRGIQIHEINNNNDIEFMNECYNADGTITPLMKYYIDRINDISPITWNKFIWDECYWDTCNYEISGLAFIPSLYDVKIENIT